jgi:hypothetical protein
VVDEIWSLEAGGQWRWVFGEMIPTSWYQANRGKNLNGVFNMGDLKREWNEAGTVFLSVRVLIQVHLVARTWVLVLGLYGGTVLPYCR